MFEVLGRRSLGAFVLHVYALLLLPHVPLGDGLWTNTLAQVVLVYGIATLLSRAERLRTRRRYTAPPQDEPVAA
jgi:hypothetical protein